MIKDPCITLFDLAICLSDACDLVSPALVNHHKKVAYISSCIGEKLGLSDTHLRDLVLAGIVHDIGALSLAERIDTLSFETSNDTGHAQVGYMLLNLFEPLGTIADIVRYHHLYWNQSSGDSDKQSVAALQSDILQLADRIAILMSNKGSILGQSRSITDRITAERGTMFNPAAVDAFVKLAECEYFWLDTVSPTIYRKLRRRLRFSSLILSIDELFGLATLFSQIIDFRSRFTYAHSAGVAVTTAELAKLSGFSKRECHYMHIAGLLHDLGKLAIPKEILEKEGKLDTEEFDIIRAHAYHTFRLLDTLDDFEQINEWAAFHHEKISGKGYPFHHTGDDLSLGSRIMAVADIFTALTEDRPYRSGLETNDALSLLRSMSKNQSIDATIVGLLESNVTTINANRQIAQTTTGQLYNSVMQKQVHF